MATKRVFTSGEYAQRLSRFRAMMVSQGVGIAIVDDIETMIWLSGYGVSENLWRCCVVPVDGEPFLVVRSLDAPQAHERSWITDIVTFRDDQDPVEVVAERLGELGNGASAIGIDGESSSLTRRRLARLEQALPNAAFSDIHEAKAELRWIKSEEEIAHLQRVAELADAAFSVALANARPGGNQRELAAAVSGAFYRLGLDDGYIGLVTVGTDWNSLHGYISDEPLVEGSIVHVELLPRLAGYSARLMRSICIGELSQERVGAMQALVAAQDRQLEALRPGARACDVDRIAREAILSAGLRESYDNVTGYTLGILPPASPHTSDFSRCFTPASRWRVEAGMVFHMYLSAKGLAISESVVVRNDGAVRFTQTDRVLFEVPLEAG